MKNSMIRTAAAAVAAAVLLSVGTCAAPVTSADSAILMDACSGRILWEDRSDTRSLIASTTKIMTGLLIAEQCDLQQVVTVPAEAVQVEGSSMGLKPDERLTIEELMYGMLLQSGNDAAMALAICCDGSIAAFAERMNRRSRELGLADTHFSNPHGLDSEENYSTAFDLAQLTCTAMDNPAFYRIVSTKTIELRGRRLENHNRLLWQYKGAVGVKTGYTKAAGRILVSCAQRQGRRLIAVTISDRNDWQDHKTLLDYGFSQFQYHLLWDASQAVAELPVISGAVPSCCLVLREDLFYPLQENEITELTFELPDFVYAPVLAGEKAGMLHIMIKGKEMDAVPLVWEETVLEGA